MALLLVVAILALILRHRRRRNIRMIAMPPSPAASIRSVYGIGLTPFIPTHYDATNGGQVTGMTLRMDKETSCSQTTIACPVSEESGSGAPSPVVASTEQSGATSPTVLRTLQAQYDQLWCEVQDLRGERFDSEDPPGYEEGDVTTAGIQPSG